MGRKGRVDVKGNIVKSAGAWPLSGSHNSRLKIFIFSWLPPNENQICSERVKQFPSLWWMESDFWSRNCIKFWMVGRKKLQSEMLELKRTGPLLAGDEDVLTDRCDRRYFLLLFVSDVIYIQRLKTKFLRTYRYS